ncbi:MAG TPA: hypothetical protein VFV34_15290, partial [Blastocatellia bacterium]|nr:hypothetical protein [Blastocatellia bacterium]
MADLIEDYYIDPKFERPWLQTADTLEENIRLEKQEIANVRAVIVNSVAEMGGRRKVWKNELDELRLEFKGTIHAPSFLSPRRRKRYRRYLNLERLFSDLPQRGAYATRDVHRKTHGCLAATFKVRGDLEPDLAKGLFLPGSNYDAVVRFSNASPKAQPDAAPDGRGMAVKLLPPRTLPRDDDPQAVVKQWLRGHKDLSIAPSEVNRRGLLDILTVNFQVFFTNSPPRYGTVNQAFLHITDEDAVLPDLWRLFHTAFFRGLSGWERQLAAAGSIIYNPLYQKYYSMAPSRLGSRSDPDRTAVKYVWEPRRGGEYDDLTRA